MSDFLPETDSLPEQSEDMDRAFLLGLKEMCATQSRFALAERAEHPALYRFAAEVRTWRNGGFVSIDDIYSEIGKGYRSSVYEDWAWTVSRRARRIAQTLGPIARDALLVCSKEEDEVTLNEARESVQEAYDALYGRPEDLI